MIRKKTTYIASLVLCHTHIGAVSELILKWYGKSAIEAPVWALSAPANKLYFINQAKHKFIGCCICKGWPLSYLSSSNLTDKMMWAASFANIWRTFLIVAVLGLVHPSACGCGEITWEIWFMTPNPLTLYSICSRCKYTHFIFKISKVFWFLICVCNLKVYKNASSF